jgi:hypothetical protein
MTLFSASSRFAIRDVFIFLCEETKRARTPIIGKKNSTKLVRMGPHGLGRRVFAGPGAGQAIINGVYVQPWPPMSASVV